MDDSEVRRFGRLFGEFLTHVVEPARAAGDGRESLSDRLEQFLGVNPATLPVVTEHFLALEHATVQIAIEHLLERPGVSHELVGVAGGGRSFESLTEILAMGEVHGTFWLGAVDYAAVPVSVDEERTCVRFGLYLIDEGGRRSAVLLRGENPQHGQPAMLEVLAHEIGHAQQWLAELRAERARWNTLRSQVLSFEPSAFSPGAGPVRFVQRPDLSRAEVIMPDGLLERVERQVVGVAEHRDRLVTEGRHLKRGVLLYGPPGTGKTHTVRYLTGALREFTVVLLAGPAIQFVSEACALARTLQPALIVLEDCDLVAEDRSFTPGGNPLLFSLLDEMDGLGSDVDVCFLLTTNRVDLLETALAQRPGRVDLAVEIPLPDGAGRRRLLELYGRGIEVSDPDAEALVDRTEGVPASLIKELTRRATLLAADRDSPLTTGADLHAAAQELLAAQEALTRRLLGTSPPDHGWPADGAAAETTGPEPGERPGPAVAPLVGPRGWFAYGPVVRRWRRSG